MNVSPRRLGVLIAALAALPLAFAACHPGSAMTASTGDAAGDGAVGSAPSTHPHPSVSLRPPLPPPPGCRAVTVIGAPKMTSFQPVIGDASVPATVLELADLPDEVWVDLADGERLVTKHPRSTRETSFSGPGRIRSCVANGEESWVVNGKFESVATSGERPGPEEWVVTPAGVVRYGSSRLEVVVTKESAKDGARAEIKVTTGTAYAWTGDEMGALKPPAKPDPTAPHLDDGWTRIDAPRTLTLTEKRGAKPEAEAQAAIDRCADAEKVAKQMTAIVAAPDASLKASAPGQVVARRVAQAACSVALIRVGALPASPAKDALTLTLKGIVPAHRRGRGGAFPRRPL